MGLGGAHVRGAGRAGGAVLEDCWIPPAFGESCKRVCYRCSFRIKASASDSTHLRTPQANGRRCPCYASLSRGEAESYASNPKGFTGWLPHRVHSQPCPGNCFASPRLRELATFPPHSLPRCGCPREIVRTPQVMDRRQGESFIDRVASWSSSAPSTIPCVFCRATPHRTAAARAGAGQGSSLVVGGGCHKPAVEVPSAMSSLDRIALASRRNVSLRPPPYRRPEIFSRHPGP